MRFLISFFFTLFASVNVFGYEAPPLVVYGENDDRQDLSMKSGPSIFAKQSSAVALVVEKSDLRVGYQEQHYFLATKPLQERYGTCPEERFAKQPTAGLCTAFLIKENFVVTAGHCLLGHEDCHSLAFVFGWHFSLNESDGVQNKISKKNVYSCHRVIYHSLGEDSGVDLALLQLKSSVKGVEPLKIDQGEKLDSSSSFYSLGHPLGLPQKISTNGRLIDNSNSHYFATDLDSYSISSGSPVFDQKKGLVQGVLIRGQEDFENKGGCKVSAVCNSSICLGEEVLRAKIINQVLANFDSSKENFWNMKKSCKL